METPALPSAVRATPCKKDRLCTPAELGRWSAQPRQGAFRKLALLDCRLERVLLTTVRVLSLAPRARQLVEQVTAATMSECSGAQIRECLLAVAQCASHCLARLWFCHGQTSPTIALTRRPVASAQCIALHPLLASQRDSLAAPLARWRVYCLSAVHLRQQLAEHRPGAHREGRGLTTSSAPLPGKWLTWSVWHMSSPTITTTLPCICVRNSCEQGLIKPQSWCWRAFPQSLPRWSPSTSAPVSWPNLRTCTKRVTKA
mmetsp:Transcript_11953/g.24767  ORF Transcript_11953/g.24767 Transcript_11953/m.24767 type:complete len:258 (+) Transcript_11953:181-954(+)